MVEFIEQKHDELVQRRREITPFYDEVIRLDRAIEALNLLGIGQPGSNGGKQIVQEHSTVAGLATVTWNVKKGRGRPKGSKNRKVGRPKGSGGRLVQVMGVLEEARTPLSVKDIAMRIGIKPNYLYRVLPQLGREGKVTKHGSLWRA